MTQLQESFKKKEPDSKNFLSQVHKALLEPVRRWPTDDDVTKAAVERPLYRENKGTECFFVLRRLAEELQGKECPQIIHGRESTKYSIEHILPQTLTGAWESDLQAWNEEPLRLSTERRDVIGNLTLTAYNSELAQKRFAEKKRFVEENLFLKLSKGIASASRWCRSDIDKRSKELASLACAIWPRPDVA
jgi:hypothetical protein